MLFELHRLALTTVLCLFRSFAAFIVQITRHTNLYKVLMTFLTFIFAFIDSVLPTHRLNSCPPLIKACVQFDIAYFTLSSIIPDVNLSPATLTGHGVFFFLSSRWTPPPSSLEALMRLILWSIRIKSKSLSFFFS
jgi:hypothetical protein